MNATRLSSIPGILTLLAACATMPPPEPMEWRGSATANPGFTGAGANAAAVSTAGATTASVAFREASGMSGTVRPWHVHLGTCGNDQGIVGDANAYSPLRPGADGAATSNATLSVPLDPTRSYFVNIHKSPAELQTIVACGALTRTGMTSAMTSAAASTATSAATPSGHGMMHSTAATAEQSSTASSPEARMVHVGLNEYRIDMPDTLPTGRVTFHVMNYGAIPHSFGIRSGSGSSGYGAGTGTTAAFDRSLPSPLQPGQTTTLEVDLQAGSYVTYCPVGDHVSAHAMAKTVTAK